MLQVILDPIIYVRLAQLDRAFGYGPKGRGFESSNARFHICLRTFSAFVYVIMHIGLYFVYVYVYHDMCLH